jgi:hypothetical protein
MRDGPASWCLARKQAFGLTTSRQRRRRILHRPVSQHTISVPQTAVVVRTLENLYTGRLQVQPCGAIVAQNQRLTTDKSNLQQHCNHLFAHSHIDSAQFFGVPRYDTRSIHGCQAESKLRRLTYRRSHASKYFWSPSMPHNYAPTEQRQPTKSLGCRHLTSLPKRGTYRSWP